MGKMGGLGQGPFVLVAGVLSGLGKAAHGVQGDDGIERRDVREFLFQVRTFVEQLVVYGASAVTRTAPATCSTIGSSVGEVGGLEGLRQGLRDRLGPLRHRIGQGAGGRLGGSLSWASGSIPGESVREPPLSGAAVRLPVELASTSVWVLA